MPKQIDQQRETRLLELLSEKGEADIAVLSGELGASEATIRRDLARLEKRRLVTRTRGGARLSEPLSLVARSLEGKKHEMRQEKERIARKAAEMVQPGMKIIVDSGSTTWLLAAHLKTKAPLHVVTTALTVIEELGSVEGVEIFAMGGQFNRRNMDFVGSATVGAFAYLHVDLAFLASDCLIPGRGTFADTAEGANILKAMAQCADCVVIVADHTKMNRRGLFLALDPSMIHCLIMDAGVGDDERLLLEQEPYQLVLV